MSQNQPASAESMPAMVTRLDGESVEIQVTADMVKRGLVVAPVLM